MGPFTKVALPHEDILEGRLEMNIFAADLWRVVQGSAPRVYQDPSLFFRKTYQTRGLSYILELARKRLEGRSGDAVIQLQTPFGGGKTHTLIALYHKAREWKAKVAVIDGTALDAKQSRLWEEIERQLTGEVRLTAGDVSPGKENLIKLLSAHSPVLILIDELLKYFNKAAVVKVGDSNLAAQTFAFIQELSETIAGMGNALLILTLPSSTLERHGEVEERYFCQLQKVVGRIEKICTPVEDDEVVDVIRSRLFQRIDENKAKEIVDIFVDHAVAEGLLSATEAPLYRGRFLKSYPFKPEVIDVLYHRWGTFPTFQRTRGVLRLLSLVIHDLLQSNIPFIRLGDFNLSNSELRRELLKHIGGEPWNSVLLEDITSKNARAKKVDENLQTSLKPFNLGTVVSTTIFLYSFSGRGQKSCTHKEIKLSTLLPDFSSSHIDTVITEIKEKLFYISDNELCFQLQPNLNKMILVKEENVLENELAEEEKNLIQKYLSKEKKLKVIIWPKFSRDVPDTQELKLIILNKPEPEKEFLEKCGEERRVYRNTLIFLCYDENQKVAFQRFLKNYLALRAISKEKSQDLQEQQKKEISNKLQKAEKSEYEELRKYYRKVWLPFKDGFKSIDLGLPTYQEKRHLDKEVFERLKEEGEILEKISPAVIKEKYLSLNEYVPSRNLLNTFLTTPGEFRISSEEVLRAGIKEAVERGLFGLGYLDEGKIVCEYFKELPKVEFIDNEILIKPELCTKKEEQTTKKPEELYIPGRPPTQSEEKETGKVENGGQSKDYISNKYKQLSLKMKVPIGGISNIAKIVTYLKDKFENLGIEITISCSNGEILKSDFEDKIEETLRQSNIKVEEIVKN